MKKISDETLKFLKSVQLNVQHSAKQPVEHTPPDSVFMRVFKNGKTYWSNDAIRMYNLQYQPKKEKISTTGKVSYIKEGNAIDIFTSTDWSQLSIKPEQELIFVSIAARNFGNYDTADGTWYTDGVIPSRRLEEGDWLSKDAMKLLTDTYDLDWSEGHIDFCILEEYQIVANNAVYYIPKVGKRGKLKGKLTYVRRDNAQVYALVPVLPEDSTEAKEARNRRKEVPEELADKPITYRESYEAVHGVPFDEDLNNSFAAMDFEKDDEVEKEIEKIEKEDAYVDPFDEPEVKPQIGELKGSAIVDLNELSKKLTGKVIMQEEIEFEEVSSAAESAEEIVEDEKDPGEDWTEKTFDKKPPKTKAKTTEIPPSAYSSILDELLGKK